MSETADATESTPTSERIALSSLIVLASLAITPALFATGFTSFEMFRREVLVLLAATAFTLWSVETLRAGGIRLNAGRACVPLILFVCWVTITPAWGPTWLVGADDISGILAAGAMSLVLVSPTGKRPGWHLFSGAVGLGAAIAGLFGLLDLGGVSLFTTIWDPEGATGSFDTLEFASSYYMIALPLLAAGIAAGSKVSRGISAAGLLLGGAHFAVAGTSTTQPIFAAIALGLAAAAIMATKTKSGGIRPIALAGAALVLGASLIGPFAIKTEFEPYNAATSTPIIAYDQIDYNPDGLKEGVPRNTRYAITRYEQIKSEQEADYLANVRAKMAAEKPVIGQGAGAWWVGQTRVVITDHPYMTKRFDIYPAFRSTHHAYYKVLIEYGAIGLLLLCLWFLGGVMIIKDVLTTHESDDPDHGTILFGLFAAFLAALLVGFEGVLLDGAASTLMLFATFGFLANFAGEKLDASEAGWGGAWGEKGSGHAFSPALFAICFAAGLLTLGGFSLTSHYLRSMGDQFMLYSKFDKASPAYDSAHEVFPAYGEVLYNQVIAESSRREAKKSLREQVETLQLARVLRPDDARLIHLQGITYTKRSQPREAMELDKAAIHRFPGYLDAYKNLALSYNRVTEMQKAVDTLEEMVALELPSKLIPGLEESIGQMYEGPLKQPAKALSHYKNGLKHTELAFMRERLRAKVKELNKRIERERLMREGKPVPKELLPEQPHDHAGEVLGVPGHEGHNH